MIKIGFIAGLSGKYSSLGNSVHNGTLLAFEEINYTINGSKIKLIQKDDKQDNKIAKKVITELLDDDVKIIIGNSTSSMTEISIKEIENKKDVLLISPTASSNQFSNIDDNFLRTQISNNSKMFDTLSKYLIKNSLLNISIIYDENNLSYVNSFTNNFEKSFLLQGGKNLENKIKINQDYKKIISKLASNESDLILIIANSLDSSKLIQYIKLNNIKTKIVCSAWSKTNEFLTNGGKSVEGVVILTSYNDSSQNKKYLEFVKRYENRYKKKPSAFAAQAYETAHIIITTLKNNENIVKVKENILLKKDFDGLQGLIRFNSYGDVLRESFLMSVKNSKFEKFD